MNVIANGKKEGDFRFNCDACLCVFDANKTDDNFIIANEEHNRRMMPTSEGEPTDDPIIKLRVYNIVDEDIITAKCECPYCHEYATSTKRTWKLVCKWTPMI